MKFYFHITMWVHVCHATLIHACLSRLHIWTPQEKAEKKNHLKNKYLNKQNVGSLSHFFSPSNFICYATGTSFLCGILYLQKFHEKYPNKWKWKYEKKNRCLILVACSRVDSHLTCVRLFKTDKNKFIRI